MCRVTLKQVLTLIIDREAREIMYLVASVRPSACLSVRPCVCVGVPRAHYTPLQRYMGYVCLFVNNHHYQSKVIVCVSVISRRLRIVARMRSIGF